MASRNKILSVFSFLLLVGSILPALMIYRGFEIFWILGVGIALFVSIATTKGYDIKITLLDIAIVLFVIYSILHYTLLTDFNFLHITFWVFLSYPLCYYLLLLLFSDNSALKKTPAFATIIVFIASIQCLIGILQYVGIYPSANSNFAVIGTFYSPNALSMFLAVAALMSFWNIRASKSKMARWIYGLLLILFGVFIVTLKARSSWYALVFGFTTLMAFDLKRFQFFQKITKKKKTVIGFLFLCVFSLASFYVYNMKRDSANSRVFISQISLNESLKKPLLGHGIFSFKGTYNLVKSDYFNQTNREWSEVKNGGYTYHAFNEFIYLFFEIGGVGLLVFLSVLIVLFLGFRITYESKMALAILVMLCTFSLLSYPIYIPHIAFLGIFVAAIIRKDGNYKTLFLFRKRWHAKTVKSGGIILSMLLLFIAISKTNARINMINYHKNPNQITNSDKQKIIDIFMNTDDIGESNFYLGQNLYLRGYKNEGFSYMKKGFYELLEPGMGELLAGYLYQERMFDDAEKVLKINIGNEPFRYKPKMDYAVFLGDQGRVFEQNTVLKTIINLPVKIPSESVENYKRQASKILKRNMKSH